MRNIKKLFVSHYPFSFLVLLALLVIVSLWQLGNLYFWGDDWDVFLKAIHPELNMWGTDSGPFGVGPYRYFHTVFLFLYPLFKISNFQIPLNLAVSDARVKSLTLKELDELGYIQE